MRKQVLRVVSCKVVVLEVQWAEIETEPLAHRCRQDPDFPIERA
jgi:hypothetical protein